MAGALVTTAYHHVRSRREAERVIEERIRARFQAIIEEAQDFFFLLDTNGIITYTSPSVETAAIGTPPKHLDDLLDMLEGTPRDIARTVFYDTAKATGTLKVSVATAIGRRWIQLHLNDQTSNPAVGGIIVTGRNITDQENLSTELARQATADEL
ncbi:MAG: PAS domain-containing protein, partial [Actinomycetota bacterium]|nr:PAS domain-containing protein [Actinomycetota bacterium]